MRGVCRYLSLSGNELTGTFPFSSASLPNLQYAVCHLLETRLVMFEMVSSCFGSRTLDLSSNLLNGTIPAVNGLTNLTCDRGNISQLLSLCYVHGCFDVGTSL